MKLRSPAILKILACTVVAVACLFSARPAHAYIVVPVSAVIKQVTLPIPNFHPSLPGYCFAQSVIEVPDVPGVQYYHVTYVHVASGQVAVSTNAPVDIIQVNVNGYHGEEHPGPGLHWIPLTGNFGATCGDAASYAADDWTDPTAEAWLPNDPPIAVIRVTRSKTSSFDVSFDGGGSIAPESGTNIVKWEWDFGDTKTATGQIADHTYEHAGTFTVTLKVTDSKNQTDTATTAVAATPALLTLSSGVTNGKIFSVEVSVKNCGEVPLTNTVFKDPQGVFDNGTGDPLARAEIEYFEGPTPPLPSTLAPDETFVSTVTFFIARQGEVQIQSTVTGTDDTGRWSSGSRAQIQIGKRTLTEEEVQKIYADIMMDASQTVGGLVNAAKIRIGQIIAWASGPQGTSVPPEWLTGPIGEAIVVPPGTQLADPPPWLNLTAARTLGLDDRAFGFMGDDPNKALPLIATFADHFATAGGKVVDEKGRSTYDTLKYAAEFYGHVASGDEAFKADVSRHFNEMTKEAQAQGLEGLKLVGEIVALAAEEDPLYPTDRLENSPRLKAFGENAAAALDGALKATYAKTAELVQLAKADPHAASGQLGDLLGAGSTSFAIDTALTEVGIKGVQRLGKVIEGTLPTARTGASLNAARAAADAKAAALAATGDGVSAVIGRQTIESLGEGAVIGPAQLEQLGGFYGKDAQQVQKIITELNAKYGVDIEIQVRPGNPASLKYYADGTGVPKPEWVKPKNTEFIDVQYLGAPEGTLGKATVFKPVKPDAAKLARLNPAEQETVLARFKSQEKLYKDATEEGGKFHKLLQDSKKPEGATYTTGLGTNDVTGLKYSLHPAGNDAFVVIDEAAGGKFVLSDADYQAVVNAKTGGHIPAWKQRGKIEIELKARLAKETVSFGGHGWSHSGFDFTKALSEVFMQFATESSAPAAARRAWQWFIERGDLPEWMHKIHIDEALRLGHPPSSDELVEAVLKKFRPGTFVVKFNGSNFRVGYGAGIR